MPMRLIQITLPAQRKKTILQIAETHNALDVWWEPKNEDGQGIISVLVDRTNQQDVLDSIQIHLQDESNWRATILPVEGTIPKIEKNIPDKPKQFKWRKSLSREELYQEVSNGAEGDFIYYLMVILSTIVAAIGLIQDNVAIVIAAMVIAPLLGPNLALAFGTALGERELITKSLKTSISGIILAIIPCIIVGYFLPVDLNSTELSSRTMVNFSAIILALASGAAAVLSLTTGVSSALVGVMVSVALLPPAAAIGIFIGLAQFSAAFDSLTLLLTNLICVGISAQMILLLMGIRPRTFIEKRAAKQSSLVQLGINLLFLIAIILVIALKN